MSAIQEVNHKKISLKKLEINGLCRVNLPRFEGKLALGVVNSFQAIYIEGKEPYLMVWVEMLIEGNIRPFELENLEPMPKTANGWESALVAEIIRSEASI